jgi:hypothetical protein
MASKVTRPLAQTQGRSGDTGDTRKLWSRQDATAVEGAVSQGATDQATALADAITAIDAQIAAQEQVIQGITDQMTALQNATAPDGSVMDNTDQLAALQTQLDAETAILQGMQDEQSAMQAELDALNGVASATGGTTTDQPATGTGGAAGATQANLARARAAVGQMRAHLAQHVAPVVLQSRDIPVGDIQPLLDDLMKAAQALQDLITQAGGTPPATASNTVILAELARVLGTTPTFRAIHALRDDVSNGRQYTKKMREDVVKAHVRAHGAEHTNAALIQKSIASFTVEELQLEIDRLEDIARTTLTSGRHVGPNARTRIVDEPNQPGEKVPANSARRVAQETKSRRMRP